MAEAVIRGERAENVINACVSAGITVGNVGREDEITVRLSVPEKNVKILAELCRRNMCELDGLRPSGVFSAGRTAARRARLAVVAAIFAAALFASSLFLWKIDVVGNEKLSDGEILRALSKCGVDIGTYWPGIEADTVRASVLRLLPDAAWLTVNVSGSRAKVVILERKQTPEIYDEYAPADMIADTDGVITKMTVLNGYSDLSQGSTVAAGETLIEGSAGSVSGREHKMCAKGEIWADTVRKLTAVSPALTKCRNGAVKTRVSVKLGKRMINIFPDSGKSIDGCDKITKEYKMGIKDLFSLPVSLVTTSVSARYPADSINADPAEVQAHLMTYLGDNIDGEISSYEFSSFSEGDAVYITLSAMCNENIARLSGHAYPTP